MAWQVTVQSGLKEVVLPDGLRYQGGAVVVLDDAQYGQLSASAVSALFSSASQLEVGNAATATNLAGGATVPAYLAPTVTTLAFASSIEIDAALGNVFSVTLTASTGTLANPTSPVDGQPVRVRITQGGSGGYTLAYGSAWDFGAAGAPTLSTAVGACDYLVGEYNAAKSKWCVAASLGY
jgi:hypothetical protein